MPPKRGYSLRALLLVALVMGMIPLLAQNQVPPAASQTDQKSPGLDPMTSQTPDSEAPSFTDVEKVLTSIDSVLVQYRKYDKSTLEKKLKDLRSQKAELEKVVLTNQEAGVYKVVWTPPTTLDPLLQEARNELTKYNNTVENTGANFEKQMTKIEQEILRLRENATNAVSPAKEDIDKQIQNLTGARSVMLKEYHFTKLLRLEQSATNLLSSVKP